MTERPAIPAYGDAERTAWRMVLAAIEAAIDVEGLQPFDRGALAELHAHAAWYTGASGMTIPPTPSPTRHPHAPSVDGDVSELARHGVDATTLAVLIYTARLRHIEQLERQSDADLLSVHRIGPARLNAIRAALKRYRDETRAPANHPSRRPERQ